MADSLFVFCAGIAISMGLAYLWLGIVQKEGSKRLIFGAFALVSGIYYLLHAFPDLFLIRLFFATVMFILFPWYFAIETEYKRPVILWIITGLGIGYYLSALTISYHNLLNLQYLFSYGVYALTALYALRCLWEIRSKNVLPILPFFVVTVYYIIFILEEFVHVTMRAELPWRNFISFTFLDLFPVVIIGMKLVLLTNDQKVKSQLEQAVDVYGQNVKLILDQSERFVLSLNPDGTVIYANPYFMNFFASEEEVIHRNFMEYLPEGSRSEFEEKVLMSLNRKGNFVTDFHPSDEVLAISWSYVKLKSDSPGENIYRILLFGADISEQKAAQLELLNTNRNLKLLKDRLHAENIQLRYEQYNRIEQGSLLGKSPNFNYVLNRVADVAGLDVPVLLLGETGVGKEIIANTIHRKSNRSSGPFIKVNCAAIPIELLESELFGFEKGAFTGADRSKKGFFELAHGGTLFLDEIGELPLSVQPKLLRAFEEGEIQRLGSEKTTRVDIRILAATNRNLEKDVEKGQFRLDLYYRINVFPITIPPLRKRIEDIPILVEAFVLEFSNKYSKTIRQISESLMDELIAYPWPGNIRELRNVIERAVITSSESVLKLASPLPSKSHIKELVLDVPGPATSELGSLEQFERSYITRVLEHCNWKISGESGAAQLLKLPPSTLRSKMKKLDIHTP